MHENIFDKPEKMRSFELEASIHSPYSVDRLFRCLKWLFQINVAEYMNPIGNPKKTKNLKNSSLIRYSNRNQHRCKYLIRLCPCCSRTPDGYNVCIFAYGQTGNIFWQRKIVLIFYVYNIVYWLEKLARIYRSCSKVANSFVKATRKIFQLPQIDAIGANSPMKRQSDRYCPFGGSKNATLTSIM